MERPMFGVQSDERQAIAEFLGTYWGMESEEEIRDIRESMRARVIRDYMSDGPGYIGSIYFVVFGGGPEFHMVFTKGRDGEFEHIGSEFPVAEKLPEPLGHIPPSRHDPGCTGNPNRCDCLDDPGALLTNDGR